MAQQDGSPVRSAALPAGGGGYVAAVARVRSRDQLRVALRGIRGDSTIKLGSRLLELGLITQDQLDGALRLQRTDTRHLGEILSDLGLVSKDQLYQVLCEKLGIPLIDLVHFDVDPAVIRLVPEELARASGVLPLCRNDGKLVVAVSDPLDPAPLERVRFAAQTPVVPVLAPREEIDQAIRAHYRGEPMMTRRDAAAAARPQQRMDTLVAEGGEDADKLVGRIFDDAGAAEASDIHIDASAGPQHVTVRFRRDGILSEYVRLPVQMRAGIQTRVKAMAGMDVSDRRRAQEGRITVARTGSAELQLRVVTIPTRDGNEDIAIKILPPREAFPLQMLGLPDSVLTGVEQLAAKPQGLILIAGPAGSGKTTTAHAILSHVNAPGMKIWTVESPVEIVRPGFSQVEASERSAGDFAATVRSVMLADPDVIFIGELRDRETAVLAVEASLKGCLVVSTLHGSRAAETYARVVDMGADAYSLADALLGVVSQRLARRLCMKCRISRPLTADETNALLEEYCSGTPLQTADVRAEWNERFGGELKIYGASGCDVCSNTGYRGRIGLYELMPGGTAMRSLLLQRGSVEEIVAVVVRRGWRTLKQDGIEKALAGHCDMREVHAATV